MANQVNIKDSSDIKLWACFKTALYSLCHASAKACQQVDSSLDVTQDLIDTAKVYSDQMKREAELESAKQLKLLQDS